MYDKHKDLLSKTKFQMLYDMWFCFLKQNLWGQVNEFSPRP